MPDNHAVLLVIDSSQFYLFSTDWFKRAADDASFYYPDVLTNEEVTCKLDENDLSTFLDCLEKEAKYYDITVEPEILVIRKLNEKKHNDVYDVLIEFLADVAKAHPEAFDDVAAVLAEMAYEEYDGIPDCYSIFSTDIMNTIENLDADDEFKMRLIGRMMKYVYKTINFVDDKAVVEFEVKKLDNGNYLFIVESHKFIVDEETAREIIEYMAKENKEAEKYEKCYCGCFVHVTFMPKSELPFDDIEFPVPDDDAEDSDDEDDDAPLAMSLAL
jgi:hypothetical protein